MSLSMTLSDLNDFKTCLRNVVCVFLNMVYMKSSEATDVDQSM